MATVDLDQAFRRYNGFLHETPIENLTTYGSRMLRGGANSYSPCVLDKNEWENFYQTLPVDYDIQNDRSFDLTRSTYNRLMDVGAPVPEPTTSESLRTGYCGPNNDSYTRPAIVQNRVRRSEPAYRLHLSDRTALHFMLADPMEGVLPYGRVGDEMTTAKSTTHRDFKWRGSFCDTRPKHQTMEREVFRRGKTDLHGREDLCKVVKFDDDDSEGFFKERLMRLKKPYLWPINTITHEPLGGSLSYHQHDPCTVNRQDIWPCGEKNHIDCQIRIPNDRCRIFAHQQKDMPRVRDRHFNYKSYLDMRYPIRNYECWEEVPKQCYT